MNKGNWRRPTFENENRNSFQRSGYENYQNNRQYSNRSRGDYRRGNKFHHNRKPYERPPGRGFYHTNRQSHQTANYEELQIPQSPLEIKITSFVNAVQNQGTIGQLVLIANEKDNATAILQNATTNTKNYILDVALNSVTDKFELTINNEVLGEAHKSKGKQTAKTELCEEVLDKLKKRCFYVLKKDNIEEVATRENEKKEEPQAASSFQGSKAYSMMLKMGWSGKGLGAEEQGEQKTVADKMVKNITKGGLGTETVTSKIDQILQDYISSSKITTLAFDSSFSKEERAQIHTLAQKYNLKSKSQGKGSDRRITISKKMAKWDLVKELLRCDLENTSYKLSIPEDFHHLWLDVKDSLQNNVYL